MTFHLLDGTLQIDILYESEYQDLEDNICVSIIERCPPDERLLRAGETYIYLTPEEARELGQTLLDVSKNSESERGKLY